jgi:hypothetical protein
LLLANARAIVPTLRYHVDTAKGIHVQSVTLSKNSESAKIDRAFEEEETTTWSRSWSSQDKDDPDNWYWRAGSESLIEARVTHDTYHYDSSHGLGEKGQAQGGHFFAKDDRSTTKSRAAVAEWEGESFGDFALC